MNSDEVLARYGTKTDEGLIGAIPVREVASSVRVLLEASADLPGLVRALIGTEFRADATIVGGGREEDLQMATAVALQRCALAGSLPLYMWNGVHWYALRDSFFTSRAMLDTTDGRSEEARPVAFGSWVNGQAHPSDFASADDSMHLAAVALPYPVQTTSLGAHAAVEYARSLTGGGNAAQSLGGPTSSWFPSPGESLKSWVFRREVEAEAQRRLNEGATAKTVLNGALAEMAAECGAPWRQASISATRRPSRRRP